MSNQNKLFNWWWSPHGPCEVGPLSVREIEVQLSKARRVNVVEGKNGKTISQAGWNYAVLTFLIESCTTSPEVRQKLENFAKSGNYSRWHDFKGCSVEIRRTSTVVQLIRSSVQEQVHSSSAHSTNGKPLYSQDIGSLPGLIATLQGAIATGGIDNDTLNQAVSSLSALGYQYDNELFPDLENIENYNYSLGDTPSNLAEALLWKLGKWKSYK